MSSPLSGFSRRNCFYFPVVQRRRTPDTLLIKVLLKNTEIAEAQRIERETRERLRKAAEKLKESKNEAIFYDDDDDDERCSTPEPD